MNIDASRSINRGLATTTVDRVTRHDAAGAVRREAMPIPRDMTIRPRRRRGGKIRAFLLFLLVVIAPTGAMLAYALTTPWPLYASEASLAVRTRDGRTNVASGFGGVMANLGVGLAASNDAFVVRNFLQSHDMLAILEAKTGYSKLMSAPRGDPWTRLPKGATVDDTLIYLRSMVQVKLSTIEQIITIKARAFTPDDAQQIGKAMIAAAEVFVNRLNERANVDFVAFAVDAVAKAEQRLSETRLAVNQWRNVNSSIDPARQGDMLQAIITGLESDLSKTRAEISEALGQRNAAVFEPRVRLMRAKEEALKSQIAQERARLTGRDATVAGQLLAYERLTIERDLAEKSYTSAVQSLEAARQEASQQHKYVVNIASPSRPDSVNFPTPVFHTAVTALAGLVIWGILMLLFAVIRDYRRP